MIAFPEGWFGYGKGEFAAGSGRVRFGESRFVVGQGQFAFRDRKPAATESSFNVHTGADTFSRGGFAFEPDRSSVGVGVAGTD
jgi:hypothetical protein